jgi:steroid delta-isomerase-like uncharacterized protein
MKSPKAVVKEWINAFNEQDVDAMIKLYHDDAVSVQVAVGTPLKGISAIENDLTNFFQMSPDAHTETVNLFEEKEWAVLEWESRGTFQQQGGNKKYTLRGSGFFQVINGRIIFHRGYWDKATWFKQIGLPIE